MQTSDLTPVDRSTVRDLGTFAGYAVRIIVRGDRWGLNGCLMYGKPEPMLEFYRGEYFVQRYSLDTLLAIGEHTYGRDTPRVGLCLDHGAGESIAAEPLLGALRAAIRYLGTMHCFAPHGNVGGQS